MATKQEAYPLSWPEGWIRTRIPDRKAQRAWKKSARDCCTALIRELERMGVETVVLSTNVPLTMRGDLTAGIEPLDPGAAVYFSRKMKEDFSWQEILGIHEPAPTIERIEASYRELAKKYHPDSGGDPEMFQTLVKARDHAKAWVNRKSSTAYDYVIACDLFNEVRLNIQAIKLTIAAIRQIERCGASSLLERAFKGFKALTSGGEHGATAA